MRLVNEKQKRVVTTERNLNDDRKIKGDKYMSKKWAWARFHDGCLEHLALIGFIINAALLAACKRLNVHIVPGTHFFLLLYISFCNHLALICSCNWYSKIGKHGCRRMNETWVPANEAWVPANAGTHAELLCIIFIPFHIVRSICLVVHTRCTYRTPC